MPLVHRNPPVRFTPLLVGCLPALASQSPGGGAAGAPGQPARRRGAGGAPLLPGRRRRPLPAGQGRAAVCGASRHGAAAAEAAGGGSWAPLSAPHASSGCRDAHTSEGYVCGRAAAGAGNPPLPLTTRPAPALPQVLIFKGGLQEQAGEVTEPLARIVAALDQLRASPALRLLLHTALRLGNTLNAGRKAPQRGIRLASLRKLADTRSMDGSTTLMHYLVALLLEEAPGVRAPPGAGAPRPCCAAVVALCRCTSGGTAWAGHACLAMLPPLPCLQAGWCRPLRVPVPACLLLRAGAAAGQAGQPVRGGARGAALDVCRTGESGGRRGWCGGVSHTQHAIHWQESKHSSAKQAAKCRPVT